MPKFSVDWPRSGTMRRGTCSAQATWVHRNEENGSSFWPTAMTVNTTSDRAKYHRPTSGPSRGGPSFGLQDAVNMASAAEWPTPSVGDVTGGRVVPVGTTATGRRPDGSKAQIGLQTAVRTDWPTPNSAKAGNDTTLTCSGDGRETPNKLGWAVAVEPEMWSTPAASMFNDSEDPASFRARQAILKAKHTNGNGAGTPLAVQVKESEWSTPTDWPTPNASDDRDRGSPDSPAVIRRVAIGKQVGLGVNVPGPLNPAWVATLMGFPSDWCDLPPMQSPRKGSPRTVGPWAVDNPKRRTNRRALPTES